MAEIQEERAVREAREFSERWKIKGKEDWDSLPFLNRWNVLESHKWILAEEVMPGSAMWGAGVRAIMRELRI